MKSKKIMVRIAAMGLAAVMLTGCAGKNAGSSAGNRSASEENSTKSSSGKSSNKKSKNSSSDSLVQQIKTKYAKEDNYEYAEPLYNLPTDYVFKFDDFSEKFWEQDEWECFKVFADSALEQYVDIGVEKDYDEKTITISPKLVFDLREKEGNVVGDGTWGSKSKFWLVQYYDMETGDELDKPIVTVFTIARELGTPTLTQSVQNDGYYALNWTAVEGADYYEVYEYDPGMDFATLQYTTEGTSCNYNDLESAKHYEKHWEDTYGGTSVDTEEKWIMNEMVDCIYSYFVVAKSNDDKFSGMSNMCAVEDIAGQIPYTLSDDFARDYEGDDILSLPAYVDIQMVDESVGQFLIDYDGAKVTLLSDDSIFVEAKMKNLPLSMMQIKLRGMDWDTFLAETDKLKERQQKLMTQSVTSDKDIDIPYVPDNKSDDTDENETETEEETDTEDETETETEDETDIETESETETENETEDETKKSQNPDVSTELSDTIYASTALSEWIALNMLNHESTISLDDFNEASDSDYLMDALLEAYTQNPLIGIMDTARYDYDTNSLDITYIMSAEDTESMQKDSLEKAAEIAGKIIKSEMTDYEKEAAINDYICKNASYNEEILEYINEDGTIDKDAVNKFSASFTPYGILVENYGVCESYAEAFLLISREAGIESVIETGRLDNVNHEWNRVKIDDSWYTLDVTNNDNEYMPNCYFNLPDEVASQILSEDKDGFIDSYIENYTSEGMEHEYYNMNKLYTENGEEAISMLSEQLKSGDRAAVRMDLSYGGTDIAEIVQMTLNNAGVEQVMYYYNAGVISILKNS